MAPVFSPWTENILLFTAAAPAWFTLVLFWRAGRGRAIGLTGAVLLWTVLAFAVVRYGWDAPLFGAFPARTLVYLAVPTLVVTLFRRSLAHGLNQHLLVALQLFRVVGMLFVFEWWRGVLPGVFAQAAGWGDLLTGLLALAILLRYRDTAIPRRAVRLLVLIGIADFTSAFFFGFTSSATPVQLFSFAHPNPVDTYPTGLIPEFLVPFAVCCHILSWVRANQQARESRPVAAAIPAVAQVS